MNAALGESAHELGAFPAAPSHESEPRRPGALLQPRLQSMRSLLVLLIAASTLPIAALLANQVWHERESHLEDARDQVRGLAIVTANEAEASLKEIERTLVVLAQRPQVRALDAAQCDPILGDMRALKLNIANASSLDKDGNILCSSLPPSARPWPNFGDTAWFRRLKEGDTTVIGGPVLGPVTAHWISFAGAGIHGAGGEFRGAAVMTIDLVGFKPMVHAALPKDGVAAIIDRDGVIVARSSQMAESIGRNIKDTAVGRAMLSGQSNTEVIMGNAGIERLYAYQPITGTDWFVAVGLPTRQVFAAVRESAWQNGLGLLWVVTLTSLMAYAVYRRITKPLAQLQETSHAIAQGNVHHRAADFGPRELSELAQAFNHMMDRLQESEQAAREHQDHYRRLFLASPEAICLIQEDRVVMANPAAVDLLGGQFEGDLVGRVASALVHPLDRFDVQQRARRVLDGRGELESSEIGILRNDGSTAIARMTLLPFSYQCRPAALALIVDVSVQRRLEGEVQARRAELESLVNQQVAMHTALAVAHELNQPLGAVSAYCEAALSMLEGGNVPREKLRQALERAAQQAQRAGTSLHELIDFLRRDDAPVAPFELADVIAQATQLVQREGVDKCRISVRVQKGLPPVMGNSVQVIKVLVNLLHNAAEAMHATDNREVSISASTTPEEDMAQVSVQDSGPGVSTESAQQMFTPFFSSKPQGMGLGLVISRALVSAQGGQLWCEPPGPDGGAIFRFTIPLAP